MTPQFRVYVIEAGDGSLYVGHTAHSISHRVAQHRARGKLAARIARRFGVRRLRRSLCDPKVYASREAAVAAEVRLAKRLRKHFPTVHQH